ncbi:hypothetical protein [Mycobacterium paraense]|nr:hypothetical protein [Mycobacterium paraense]
MPLMSSAAENRRPREAAGDRAEWLRSTQARALIGAALSASLLLGGAFVAVDRLHTTPSDAVDHPANPVTDDQSRAQVVEAAQQIVTLARLQTASAGYTLMSCKNRDEPPYQGAIYLTFTLPAGARPDAFFPSTAATLAAHGWARGLPPNDHAFAESLTKDPATAIIYLQSEEPSLGVLRVYGQCRNMNDHRSDSTAWVDVTDRLKAP